MKIYKLKLKLNFTQSVLFKSILLHIVFSSWLFHEIWKIPILLKDDGSE